MSSIPQWVAVSAVGLEPTRACAQQRDKLQRLPVSPRRHVALDPWHRNPVARYYPAYDEVWSRRSSHRKSAPRGRKTRTGRGMIPGPFVVAAVGLEPTTRGL